MDNPRRYGNPPFSAAVVHGGPGGGGEMAGVARRLSARTGVLEPMQTAAGLDGQVDELRSILETGGAPPLVLIGYSWGAWLGFLLAARHPALVRKLILVSSGPFEECYASGIQSVRLGRLSPSEQAEYRRCLQILDDPVAVNKDAALERLGELAAKTDSFDPLPDKEPEADAIDFRGDIYNTVWGEASKLRGSGELLAPGKRIACPVVAIHGDYDPHPAEGVQKPLARVLKEFRFVLLKDCGHMPWIERRAKDEFYAALESELA